MSRIRRSLTIDSSLGIALNYTLQATIPAYMLSRCAAALPRPHWEPYLYYVTMVGMVFLCVCVGAAAYFEADRNFTADVMRRRARNSLTFDRNNKVFDLSQIAASVRADLGQPTTPPAGASSSSSSTSNGKNTAPPGRGASLSGSSSPEATPEVNGYAQHAPAQAVRNKPQSALSSIFILRLLKNLFYRWNSYREGSTTADNASGLSNGASSTNTASSRRSPDRYLAAQQPGGERETTTPSTATTHHHAHAPTHKQQQHSMTDAARSGGMTAEGTLLPDGKLNPYTAATAAALSGSGGKAYKSKKTKQQRQQQQPDLISSDVTSASENKKQSNNKQSNRTQSSSSGNNNVNSSNNLAVTAAAARKLSADNSEGKNSAALGVSHRRSTADNTSPDNDAINNIATENNATKSNGKLFGFVSSVQQEFFSKRPTM